MKKYLLLIIMMVCAATGAWAQDYSSYYSKSNSAMTLHTPESSDQYVYWYDADEAAADAVLTINVPTDHSVSLATIATEALGSGSYTRVQINGPITDGDITTINGINAIILDLSGATLEKNESGTYTADNSILESAVNSNVKFLVLPAGMTRDDVTENNVTTEGIVNARSLSGFSGLYSAVSFSDYTSTGSSSRDVVAYCRVAGTLQPGFVATDRGSLNGSVYTRSGHTCYFPDVHCLDNRSATLSGNLNAYDMLCQPQTNGKDAKLDKNGHLTFDKKYADESSLTDDRTNIGTESIYGAFSNSNGVQTLDLRDAVFAEINDMTISYLQSTNYLTYLTIPTSSSVIETPSYFIQHNLVKEICIPSNIQKIRTHFAPSIDHIWTTAASGDIAGTVYDNGVLPSATGDLIYGHSGLTFQKAAYPCGTYTFSSNLKLIESNAFANTEPHVKDIYVLAVETPECHVDAFCTAMYVGNGGYAPTIVDGVITRDSYRNGSNWIAMLHYPRKCATPYVQRYTDPTRKYTTASNEVDGKGGVLYYPNFGEFLAAYAQGTTGYLWNAWSREYEYGMLKSTLDIGNSAWSKSIQNQANNTFLANGDSDKTNPSFTSFYDATAEGELSQPSGLEYYYNVYWDETNLNNTQSGVRLYPQAEYSSDYYMYETASQADFEDASITVYTKDGDNYTVASGSYDSSVTYYKRIQEQQTDANGNPKYESCTGGDYVAQLTYVKDTNGGYVREETLAETYTAVTESQEDIDTYYIDNSTKEVATPKVKNDTYWYENGTKPVFSAYGTYQPISGVTQYYTRTGNSEPFTYTEVNPTLNGTYYYKTGGETNTYSAGTWSPIEGQDTYYKLEGGEYTQEVPVLSNSYNGDWFYNTGSTQPTNIFSSVYQAQENVFVYYTSSDHETPVLPTFDGTYYYKNGTVNVYDYTFIGYYVNPTAGTQYYVKENNEYVAVNPKIHSGFYTYDSENKSYVEATTWQSGVTYYKNNNGVYDEASYSEIFIDGEYYTRSADTHEEDVYKSTSQWIQDVNTYYSLNNTTYTSVLPGFNGSYDYISSTEDRPIYQKTTVFVPGIYNYYHTSDGINYYNNNEAPFSKEYFYVTGKTDEYLPATTYTPGETYYTNNNGTYTETAVQFDSQNYYYADGTTTRYDSANGEYWNAHEYFTDANGAEPAETIEFDNTYYVQDRTYSWRAYDSSTDTGKQRWAQTTTYVAAATAGTGDYCPIMIDKVFNDVTNAHDYRGWHQFVLNAYAANTNIPMQPVRSYITDTDWWTICLPYDLTYNEMILFYGDAENNKVPYLCLLSNVVRNEETHTITLNFSSNIMEHVATKNASTGIWTIDENTAPSGTDVVLHKGVPYLIKPNFSNTLRQFDVYDGGLSLEEYTTLSQDRIMVSSDYYPNLYERLKEATTIAGTEFRNLQEDNIYTVPALLPTDVTTTENKVDDTPMTVNGKQYYRSAEFDYTFVGSLAKAIIPPYSYFLGMKNKKACFVYADYLESGIKESTKKSYQNTMRWNNNSCVICPNMLSSSAKNASTMYYSNGNGTHDGKITLASGKEAAQWKIYGTGVTPILQKDTYNVSGIQNAVGMMMEFGMDIFDSDEATAIICVDGVEITPTANRVYSLNGQYVGNSLEGLAKGIYIMNGKKIYVK